MSSKRTSLATRARNTSNHLGFVTCCSIAAAWSSSRSSVDVKWFASSSSKLTRERGGRRLDSPVTFTLVLALYAGKQALSSSVARAPRPRRKREKKKKKPKRAARGSVSRTGAVGMSSNTHAPHSPLLRDTSKERDSCAALFLFRLQHGLQVQGRRTHQI